ncbi:hypothetical protein I79_024780 [Cricetulus griseus]|uniref:Uncharacterized protein n=1 Tax=Cricetulus griseus TaxID=10029 RepID=G3ILL2_CRIGR|nr:hypothetical protein I79_024780 [Cricetulus griseus]
MDFTHRLTHSNDLSSTTHIQNGQVLNFYINPQFASNALFIQSEEFKQEKL